MINSLYNLLGDYMRKFFTFLGILALGCTSFIYTEKTTTVLSENDNIMVNIKEVSKDYEYDYIDAYINNMTIIPGLSGRKVDINKSYRKMKKYGTFNKNLFEYNYTKPNKSLQDNLNKYVISGNTRKNMVSLIFIVKENDDISNIISTLNEKNIKATFFVDGYFLENNNDLITSLAKSGHEIGNLSYNMDYTDSAFSWMNTIINTLTKLKTGYCYGEEESEINLKICSANRNISIKPSIIASNTPAITVKDNLKAGSLISFKINASLNRELGPIINYIYSKGYEIEILKKHLSE